MPNDKKIQLKIATPERVIFQEEADQITLPTQEGEITILPNHRALITNLSPGIIELRTDGDSLEMAVSGGFLEIHNNKLTVLADTAERAEEIDIERAEQAKQRAEERKQRIRREYDEEQYASVISQIEKNLVRLKLGKRYQKRSRARFQTNGHA
jgi:F-type H+-transporting ATPase subunit epsilon